MTLNCVTITGADDSVRPTDLLKLSADYPFVEWGILMSRSHKEGSPRFPRQSWLDDLLELKAKCPSIQLAGHICGEWVRNMRVGAIQFATERALYLPLFDRLQWNFHGASGTTVLDAMAAALQQYRHQHIFQLDGINDHLVQRLKARGIDVQGLFDQSGGAGILPKDWPEVIPGVSCGYAGGLGPDTIASELPKIAMAAGDSSIWIDMEGRVRTGTGLDLGKVRQVLEFCKDWMAVERAVDALA